jgi:hypothetical protein
LEWSDHADIPQAVAFTLNGIDFLVAQAYWPGAVVQRHVAVLPCGTVWVADSVQSEAPVVMNVHWQLPSATADVKGWSGTAEIAAQDTESTNDSSPVGWRFPAYGERQSGIRRTFTSGLAKWHWVVSGLGCGEQSLTVARGSNLIHCGQASNSGSERNPSHLPEGTWSWQFADRDASSELIQYRIPDSLTIPNLQRANSGYPLKFWDSCRGHGGGHVAR